MAGLTRYSIDTNARQKATLYVAAISVVLAVIVNLCLASWVKSTAQASNIEILYDGLSAVGVIGSLSPFAFFGAIWILFDRFLWKWRPIISLHGVPNLSGIWKGTGQSDFTENGKSTSFEMSIRITQTFSKIECRSEFENSSSTSGIVGIHGFNPTDSSCLLEFSYKNDAGTKAVINRSWDCEHSGFNWIDCHDGKMTGHYFTNRDNPTSGTFEIRKE